VTRQLVAEKIPPSCTEFFLFLGKLNYNPGQNCWENVRWPIGDSTLNKKTLQAKSKHATNINETPQLNQNHCKQKRITANKKKIEHCKKKFKKIDHCK